MPDLLDPALLGILCFAFLSNVPLGFLREGARRYSLYWFVYIHLSIPLIIALRVVNGLGWRVIPFTLALAVAGQWLGGRLRRRSRR